VNGGGSLSLGGRESGFLRRALPLAGSRSREEQQPRVRPTSRVPAPPLGRHRRRRHLPRRQCHDRYRDPLVRADHHRQRGADRPCRLRHGVAGGLLALLRRGAGGPSLLPPSKRDRRPCQRRERRADPATAPAGRSRLLAHPRARVPWRPARPPRRDGPLQRTARPGDARRRAVRARQRHLRRGDHDRRAGRAGGGRHPDRAYRRGQRPLDRRRDVRHIGGADGRARTGQRQPGARPGDDRRLPAGDAPRAAVRPRRAGAVPAGAVLRRDEPVHWAYRRADRAGLRPRGAR